MLNQDVLPHPRSGLDRPLDEGSNIFLQAVNNVLRQRLAHQVKLRPQMVKINEILLREGGPPCGGAAPFAGPGGGGVARLEGRGRPGVSWLT